MSSPSINTSTTDRLLFGHSQPWPSFHAVDDRVRGGASQSYFETTGSNGARFCGHLDITALGGAGFASQCSALGSAPLRLSPEKFDGIKITVARPLHLSAGTPTAFVLSLKNELPGHRQDGRRESVTTYEFAFDLDELTPIKNEKAPLLEKAGAQVELLARWSDFKATYRGRPAEGAPPMDSTEIRELSFMCRSNFGAQAGDFELVVVALHAARTKTRWWWSRLTTWFRAWWSRFSSWRDSSRL